MPVSTPLQPFTRVAGRTLDLVRVQKCSISELILTSYPPSLPHTSITPTTPVIPLRSPDHFLPFHQPPPYFISHPIQLRIHSFSFELLFANTNTLNSLVPFSFCCSCLVNANKRQTQFCLPYACSKDNEQYYWIKSYVNRVLRLLNSGFSTPNGQQPSEFTLPFSTTISNFLPLLKSLSSNYYLFKTLPPASDENSLNFLPPNQLTHYAYTHHLPYLLPPHSYLSYGCLFRGIMLSIILSPLQCFPSTKV